MDLWEANTAIFMPKNIKFVFGSQIRRIGEAPLTFELLLSIALEIFDCENLIFQYEDEAKDLITFNTELEYQEALNSPGETIKFMLRDPQPEELATSAYIGGPRNRSYKSHSLTAPHHKRGPSYNRMDKCTQASEWEVFFKKIEGKEDTEVEPTEFVCCLCGNNIFGHAFICRKCERMILCAECEEQDLHKHVLIKAYGKDIKSLMSMPLYEKKASFSVRNSKYSLFNAPKNKSSSSEEDLKVPAPEVPAPEVPDLLKTPDQEIPAIEAQMEINISKIGPPDLDQRSNSTPVIIEECYETSNPSFNLKSNRNDMLKHLSILEEMGFTDRTTCTRVLIKYNYNLAQAVEHLYSQSYSG